MFSRFLLFPFIFILGIYAPAYAQTASSYEQEVSEHFRNYVAILVERKIESAPTEEERQLINNAWQKFEAVRQEQGLYEAHLVWLRGYHDALRPTQKSIQNWDGVPRLTAKQYTALLALVGKARERAQQSGEMMENGRRTVYKHFFGRDRSTLPTITELMMGALLMQDFEEMNARFGDWMEMIGYEAIASIDPMPENLGKALEGHTSLVAAQADAAEAQADAAEAQADAAEAKRVVDLGKQILCLLSGNGAGSCE